MFQINDKRKCCGCTACYSICPKNCIEMRPDEEGFRYPVVDQSQCVNCGACERVCPVMQKKPIQQKDISGVAVQHKKEDVLYPSAAGGAFSAIASVTIKNDGITYGAAYDSNMVVRHMAAETIADLKRFRSSKYVQSDMGTTFQSVEGNLKAGREVCFSGTPCQVAGLKAYLKQEYENLITVDLVCKGVGSPAVLKQYVEEQEEKIQSKIVGMNFKRKTYGYHSSTMSVDFDNGQTYSCGGITDLMMRSFRSNICLRPSCAECQFKGKHRQSDLTIFDCWHFSELTGKKDNDKGYTSVLVHSSKGRKRIDDCADSLEILNIDAEQAIALDGIMVDNRVVEHPKRDEFMRILSEDGIERAVDVCIPISSADRMKEASKQVLYKLGILSFVKSIGVKRK